MLIATNVAARGLDVKDLELLVNYDVTNHYEELRTMFIVLGERVGLVGRAAL
jgi:superfamily II DNA/RNA helicase